METSRPPVEQTCFWLTRRKPREPEPLTGELAADVAIVGAGFTGLWTALFLKQLEPGLTVAILDADLAGYGASGRNAGIAGETIDHSHELAIAHFGVDEARELARLGRENLDEMEAFFAQRGIDAGWDRSGQLTVALQPSHLAALEAMRRAAERVGIEDFRILSAEETRAELASPLYRGALLSPRNALVDPIRLIEGLRAEALRLRVRIAERSGVTGFAFPRDRVRVSTAGGAVTARRVVLATNASRITSFRDSGPGSSRSTTTSLSRSRSRRLSAQGSAGRTARASSTRGPSSTTTG